METRFLIQNFPCRITLSSLHARTSPWTKFKNFKPCPSLRMALSSMVKWQHCQLVKDARRETWCNAALRTEKLLDKWWGMSRQMVPAEVWSMCGPKEVAILRNVRTKAFGWRLVASKEVWLGKLFLATWSRSSPKNFKFEVCNLKYNFWYIPLQRPTHSHLCQTLPLRKKTTAFVRCDAILWAVSTWSCDRCVVQCKRYLFSCCMYWGIEHGGYTYVGMNLASSSYISIAGWLQSKTACNPI